MSVLLQSLRRPVIGLSPSTPAALAGFLREQGYIVETCEEREGYSYYLDQDHFDDSQERTVLEQIEASGCPLVKLGRWPASVWEITGDGEIAILSTIYC
jgi:hypothetical protein